MITAEMQKVINWLRSDEGSAWSEDRIIAAKERVGDSSLGMNHYGDSRALYCPGIMSVKEETHLSAQWSWWPSGNDASNDRKAP